MAQDKADAIAAARAEGRAYDLPEVADLTEGYAIQDALAQRVGEAAGWKLAVNGKPQMQFFGVSEPVAARVFRAEVHASGAALRRGDFHALTVEPEILAVMGKDAGALDADATEAQVAEAIDRYLPAIELIDMRGLSLKDATLPQAVALNVFNAGAVTGGPGVISGALDWRTVQVTLEIDGKLEGRATGSAPQPPVEAVRWLAGHLVGQGMTLRPGDMVLCGTLLPMKVLPADARRVRVRMKWLGEVGFTLGG
jgi:2-keto-4-pentenoate hydratase